MSKKKVLVKILILVVAVFSLMTARGASAASVDEVYREIMLNMMSQCYAPLSWASSVNLNDYRGSGDAETAFTKWILNGGTGQQVRIPTLIGSGIPANKNNATMVTCQQLFLGDTTIGTGGFTGIFGMAGKALPSLSSTDLSGEIKNVGYSISEPGSATQKCVKGTYSKDGMSGEHGAGTVCWDESTTLVGEDFVKSAMITGGDRASIQAEWVSYMGGAARVSRGEIKFYDPDGKSCTISADGLLGTGAFASVKKVEKISDVDGFSGLSCKTDNYTVTTGVESITTAESDEFGTRKIKNYTDAYKEGRKYFGGSSGEKHTFTNDEKYALYYAYLGSVYGMADYGEGCKTRAWVSSNGGPIQSDGSYYVYESGAYRKKEFPSANKDLKVSVFGNDSTLLVGFYSLDNVVQSLWNITGDTATFPESGTCDEGGGGDGSGGTGGGVRDDTTSGSNINLTADNIVDCNDLDDIGAMQWILCPVMNNGQYTASWIDNQTQKWLEVKTSLYTGSEIERVWQNIRNIANVVMIVFFLVIIFSQVTGWGIDNYGIKKMLPRLIVMAILINLSFYICQIAIDLSNIFGKGLMDMFGSISGGGSGVDTSFIGSMVMGMFIAAAGAGPAAFSAGIAAMTILPQVAIAVVVAVIVLVFVVVVALIVLALMLGAREIIIVLCVILSPLAFAAFILPNTQNLFKKWWELFKAAIIIFPICGAMMGISAMLRGLFNKSGPVLEIWGYAVLMLLPYLGFFLIPMLLKNAISALGKVGGALTAMGSTIKGGGKAIGSGAMKIGQNTEAFKNRQNEVARRRQSESADRTIKKLEAMKKEKEANGGKLTDVETRRLARAHEIKRKLGREDEAARTILAEKDYANVSQKELVNKWEEAFDNGNVEEMNALTNVITSRHGPGGVNEMASRLANKEFFEVNPDGIDEAHPDGMRFKNDKMEQSFNALQSNVMQNSALSNAMQNKASDVYQMVSGGGYGDDDRRHDLDYHSEHNNIATQDKDWATQSSATLRRAAASGALSQETAQHILDSKDPAIMSGIQSDSSKREILEAAASGQLATNKDRVPSGATRQDLANAAKIQWGDKNAATDGNSSFISEAAANYRNAQGGNGDQAAARATASGERTKQEEAGARATASGMYSNSSSTLRPQVSAASGNYGTSGNQPFFGGQNYTQAPRVPQGNSQVASPAVSASQSAPAVQSAPASQSRSVTPPQGGQIPGEQAPASISTSISNRTSTTNSAPRMDRNNVVRGNNNDGKMNKRSEFGTSGNTPREFNRGGDKN